MSRSFIDDAVIYWFVFDLDVTELPSNVHVLTAWMVTLPTRSLRAVWSARSGTTWICLPSVSNDPSASEWYVVFLYGRYVHSCSSGNSKGRELEFITWPLFPSAFLNKDFFALLHASFTTTFWRLHFKIKKCRIPWEHLNCTYANIFCNQLREYTPLNMYTI